MSFCRFSSDDFNCDVYCYECVDGYQVHIASRRHEGNTPIPKLPYITEDNVAEFLDCYSKQQEWLKDAKLVEIGLEYDGESFSFDTAQEAAEFLKDCKEKGYKVPHYAIEALMEEGNEPQHV